MTIEIRVPILGESVSEATIGRWFKKAGDAVKADEPLVELETDKVTLEVNAPSSGVLAEIAAKDGETVGVGALLGQISDSGAAPAKDVKAAAPPAAKAAAPIVQPRTPAVPAAATGPAMAPSPAAAKIAADNGLDPAAIEGSGVRGQVLKGDVLAKIAPPRLLLPRRAGSCSRAGPGARAFAARRRRTRGARAHDAAAPDHRASLQGRAKHRRHADHLQRGRHERGHGAPGEIQGCVREEAWREARLHGLLRQSRRRRLKEIPSINAEIDGDDLVFKNYYHIGIAVGSEKGLIVPVVRNADELGLAGIEKTIAGLGKRARDGQLKIEELQGGTFTITNGGIYGSLMSTPILNAPQSGILGMHKIQERPVAIAGKVEIRPMMYLALSYDHRIVDGKEAVTFLVRVKEALEEPARLVLDI